MMNAVPPIPRVYDSEISTLETNTGSTVQSTGDQYPYPALGASPPTITVLDPFNSRTVFEYIRNFFPMSLTSYLSSIDGVGSRAPQRGRSLQKDASIGQQESHAGLDYQVHSYVTANFSRCGDVRVFNLEPDTNYYLHLFILPVKEYKKKRDALADANKWFNAIQSQYRDRVGAGGSSNIGSADSTGSDIMVHNYAILLFHSSLLSADNGSPSRSDYGSQHTRTGKDKELEQGSPMANAFSNFFATKPYVEEAEAMMQDYEAFLGGVSNFKCRVFRFHLVNTQSTLCHLMIESFSHWDKELRRRMGLYLSPREAPGGNIFELWRIQKEVAENCLRCGLLEEALSIFGSMVAQYHFRSKEFGPLVSKKQELDVILLGRDNLLDHKLLPPLTNATRVLKRRNSNLLSNRSRYSSAVISNYDKAYDNPLSAAAQLFRSQRNKYKQVYLTKSFIDETSILSSLLNIVGAEIFLSLILGNQTGALQRLAALLDICDRELPEEGIELSVSNLLENRKSSSSLLTFNVSYKDKHLLLYRLSMDGLKVCQFHGNTPCNIPQRDSFSSLNESMESNSTLGSSCDSIEIRDDQIIHLKKRRRPSHFQGESGGDGSGDITEDSSNYTPPVGDVLKCDINDIYGVVPNANTTCHSSIDEGDTLTHKRIHKSLGSCTTTGPHTINTGCPNTKLGSDHCHEQLYGEYQISIGDLCVKAREYFVMVGKGLHGYVLPTYTPSTHNQSLVSSDTAAIAVGDPTVQNTHQSVLHSKTTYTYTQGTSSHEQDTIYSLPSLRSDKDFIDHYLELSLLAASAFNWVGRFRCENVLLCETAKVLLTTNTTRAANLMIERVLPHFERSEWTFLFRYSQILYIECMSKLLLEPSLSLPLVNQSSVDAENDTRTDNSFPIKPSVIYNDNSLTNGLWVDSDSNVSNEKGRVGDDAENLYNYPNMFKIPKKLHQESHINVIKCLLRLIVSAPSATSSKMRHECMKETLPLWRKMGQFIKKSTSTLSFNMSMLFYGMHFSFASSSIESTPAPSKNGSPRTSLRTANFSVIGLPDLSVDLSHDDNRACTEESEAVNEIIDTSLPTTKSCHQKMPFNFPEVTFPPNVLETEVDEGFEFSLHLSTPLDLTKLVKVRKFVLDSGGRDREYRSKGEDLNGKYDSPVEVPVYIGGNGDDEEMILEVEVIFESKKDWSDNDETVRHVIGVTEITDMVFTPFDNLSPNPLKFSQTLTSGGGRMNATEKDVPTNSANSGVFSPVELLERIIVFAHPANIDDTSPVVRKIETTSPTKLKECDVNRSLNSTSCGNSEASFVINSSRTNSLDNGEVSGVLRGGNISRTAFGTKMLREARHTLSNCAAGVVTFKMPMRGCHAGDYKLRSVELRLLPPTSSTPISESDNDDNDHVQPRLVFLKEFLQESVISTGSSFPGSGAFADNALLATFSDILIRVPEPDIGAELNISLPDDCHCLFMDTDNVTYSEEGSDLSPGGNNEGHPRRVLSLTGGEGASVLAQVTLTVKNPRKLKKLFTINRDMSSPMSPRVKEDDDKSPIARRPKISYVSDPSPTDEFLPQSLSEEATKYLSCYTTSYFPVICGYAAETIDEAHSKAVLSQFFSTLSAADKEDATFVGRVVVAKERGHPEAMDICGSNRESTKEKGPRKPSSPHLLSPNSNLWKNGSKRSVKETLSFDGTKGEDTTDNMRATFDFSSCEREESPLGTNNDRPTRTRRTSGNVDSTDGRRLSHSSNSPHFPNRLSIKLHQVPANCSNVVGCNKRLIAFLGSEGDVTYIPQYDESPTNINNVISLTQMNGVDLRMSVSSIPTGVMWSANKKKSILSTHTTQCISYSGTFAPDGNLDVTPAETNQKSPAEVQEVRLPNPVIVCTWREWGSDRRRTISYSPNYLSQRQFSYGVRSTTPVYKGSLSSSLIYSPNTDFFDAHKLGAADTNGEANDVNTLLIEDLLVLKTSVVCGGDEQFKYSYSIHLRPERLSELSIREQYALQHHVSSIRFKIPFFAEHLSTGVSTPTSHQHDQDKLTRIPQVREYLSNSESVSGHNNIALLNPPFHPLLISSRCGGVDTDIPLQSNSKKGSFPPHFRLSTDSASSHKDFTAQSNAKECYTTFAHGMCGNGDENEVSGTSRYSVSGLNPNALIVVADETSLCVPISFAVNQSEKKVSRTLGRESSSQNTPSMTNTVGLHYKHIHQRVLLTRAFRTSFKFQLMHGKCFACLTVTNVLNDTSLRIDGIQLRLLGTKPCFFVARQSAYPMPEWDQCVHGGIRDTSSHPPFSQNMKNRTHPPLLPKTNTNILFELHSVSDFFPNQEVLRHEVRAVIYYRKYTAKEQAAELINKGNTSNIGNAGNVPQATPVPAQHPLSFSNIYESPKAIFESRHLSVFNVFISVELKEYHAALAKRDRYSSVRRMPGGIENTSIAVTNNGYDTFNNGQFANLKDNNRFGGMSNSISIPSRGITGSSSWLFEVGVPIKFTATIKTNINNWGNLYATLVREQPGHIAHVDPVTKSSGGQTYKDPLNCSNRQCGVPENKFQPFNLHTLSSLTLLAKVDVNPNEWVVVGPTMMKFEAPRPSSHFTPISSQGDEAKSFPSERSSGSFSISIPSFHDKEDTRPLSCQEHVISFHAIPVRVGLVSTPVVSVYRSRPHYNTRKGNCIRHSSTRGECYIDSSTNNCRRGGMYNSRVHRKDHNGQVTRGGNGIEFPECVGLHEEGLELQGEETEEEWLAASNMQRVTTDVILCRQQLLIYE